MKKYFKKSFLVWQIPIVVLCLAIGQFFIKQPLKYIFFAGQDGPSLALTNTSTIYIDKPFMIPLNIDTNGQKISGVDVKLIFDPQAVTLTKIDFSPMTSTTLRTVAPDATTITTHANQSGIIRFSAITFDGANLTGAYISSAPSNIAYLTFLPKKTGSTILSFVFDAASSKSTETNMISDTTPPTNILQTVTNLTVSVLPSASVSPVPSISLIPQPTESVLLKNPGFEDGMTGWIYAKGITTTSDAHTGSNAVSMIQNSGYVSQQINKILQADIPYTFTAWVKVTAAGTSWGSPRIRLSAYQDLGTAEYGEQNALNTVTGWQKLSITKSFSATELRHKIYFGIKNFGFDGAASADDFTTRTGGSLPVPSETVRSTPTQTPKPTSKPTPIPTATPKPIPTPTEVTLTLTPDQMINQDGQTLSDTSIWLGNGSSTDMSYTGIRFSNVQIPSGSTVKSAVLKVTSAQSQWITLKFTLNAESSGNSQRFTDTSLPSARSLTNSSFLHNSNESWEANTSYDFGPITGSIADVISRNDWTSGNSLSLIAKGSGASWGRKFISSAQLVITYSH